MTNFQAFFFIANRVVSFLAYIASHHYQTEAFIMMLCLLHYRTNTWLPQKK